MNEKYTQEDRMNGVNCPRCGFWHTAESCPPQIGYALSRYDKLQAEHTDLLRRVKELYQNIKNDNIECPDATEYTQGAKGHKRYVLNLFDTCIPEAKEAQDDTD